VDFQAAYWRVLQSAWGCVAWCGGAPRENGKKRFGNFAARYGLLLAFGKVFRLPLGCYVALLVVWMIFCGIFALAQIFLGLGVTCFVSFR